MFFNESSTMRGPKTLLLRVLMLMGIRDPDA